MMNKKQNAVILLLFLFLLALGASLFIYGKDRRREEENGRVLSEQNAEGEDRLPSGKDGEDGGSTAETEATMPPMIHPEGGTLEKRVSVPEGYVRKGKKKDNLQTFLREYSLQKDGYPVHYYDGRKKSNQSAHVAVFKLPIEKADLQQCADSIMRIYAEYYWEKGEYDRIAFHFVNGFLAEYIKWRQGYRIVVSGNSVSWSHSQGEDISYASFQEYMKMVFNYASTLSMVEESKKITLDEIRTGDILIKGGSPGHVVLVTDVCEKDNGEKAFLLAQGYMPAQEFHLLKNPLHEEDPWYYTEELTWPLETPEYTFEKGCIMRPSY